MGVRTGRFIFWGIIAITFVAQIGYDATASRLFSFQEKKIVAICFFVLTTYLSLSIILCTHDAEMHGMTIGDYLEGWKALRLLYRPFTAFWEAKFEVRMFIVLLLLTIIFVVMICILDENTILWVASNLVAYVSAICAEVMLSLFLHHSVCHVSEHAGWFPGNIICFPGKEPISMGNGLRFWIHDLVLQYEEGEIGKN
jgi:hypothetical protein